jgi:hypothetical protein
MVKRHGDIEQLEKLNSRLVSGLWLRIVRFVFISIGVAEAGFG